MGKIHLLDSATIDRIAAGEVVERPSSVVKELVENSIDAGANAVTVEIKEGGIEFIRVTDNGSGIREDDIRTAFLRHATSKITDAEDLFAIHSLGFRGEALSSIAAVSKLELITKTSDRLTGFRVILEGAEEKDFSEIGAPDGTTFIIRNLFYNTPVRRKFLKTAATEGGYVCDIMEHLAISHPDISFKLVVGSQTKFHTSGNGDMKEVIYRIYGRETANSLLPIRVEGKYFTVEGYLGKPVIVRSNRNFEIYFINNRFIRSNVIAKAIEEGYKEYLMQHKFPMCVLYITMSAGEVDVNVHPTKMDVRFSDNDLFFKELSTIIHDALKTNEMIPELSLITEDTTPVQKVVVPEPFEVKTSQDFRVAESNSYLSDSGMTVGLKKTTVTPSVNTVDIFKSIHQVSDDTVEEAFFFEEESVNTPELEEETIQADDSMPLGPMIRGEQLNLFEERILSEDNRAKFRIVGQVFDTYWIVQMDDKMLMIDQHAAHEKVNYERMIKHYREKTIYSQSLFPPIILTLSSQEAIVLSEYKEVFESLGFEVECFGGNEYALRGVPQDLFGCSEREMFLEVLDELASVGNRGSMKLVEEKIASMACKASVKGGNRLSLQEVEALLDELLTLDNPYNCPHGRPTMIIMTETEMERKFKRIV